MTAIDPVSAFRLCRSTDCRGGGAGSLSLAAAPELISDADPFYFTIRLKRKPTARIKYQSVHPIFVTRLEADQMGKHYRFASLVDLAPAVPFAAIVRCQISD